MKRASVKSRTESIRSPDVGSDDMRVARQWSSQHLGIGKKDGGGLDLSELPFSFVFSGKPSADLLDGWKASRDSRSLDNGRTEHTLTWTDSATGLSVRCVAVEYRDFPVVEWTVWFRNEGAADTPVLSDIQALNTGLPGTSEGEGVLHWFVGSRAKKEDFQPRVAPLIPGVPLHFESVGGRPSDGTMPYFNLDFGNRGSLVAVGWPGQWSARIEGTGNGARMRSGQSATRIALRPGEEIRTPLMAILFWQGGDWIRGQNLWRRWMLACNLPRPGGQLPKPFTASCVDDLFPGMLSNAADKVRVMDLCHRNGLRFDSWWTDAGWYPAAPNGPQGWWSGVGNWTPDPTRYPNGLKEVSDHAHHLGMKYIVWFEPERVASSSTLAQQHPEWVLKAGARNDHGWLLNLGNQDARKWLTDHIDKLIVEQGIDLYRQDFNMEPLPLWQANDSPDRVGMTENLHVQGYLAYWDELRRRHPDMLLDTCASGGRRLDLETLRRSVPLLRTDYRFEPTGTQGQHYAISFWIPFSGSGLYQDTPYVMRSHMNSCFGFAVDFRNQKPDWALLKRMTAEWRLIAEDGFLGDYYPMTDYSLAEDVWMAWQFHRPETGTGFVQAFRRPGCSQETMRFTLRGLDPKARYRLTDLDKKRPVVLTGTQLMSKGIQLRLPERPGSAIVIYRQA